MYRVAEMHVMPVYLLLIEFACLEPSALTSCPVCPVAKPQRPMPLPSAARPNPVDIWLHKLFDL